MRIDSYSFGKIVIEGKAYSKDVLILPYRVISPWWREEGHSLCREDLTEVISAAPEVIVIGTGDMGAMDVPENAVRYLEAKNIEVIIMKTGAAVEEFNRLSEINKTSPWLAVAAFHLTC